MTMAEFWSTSHHQSSLRITQYLCTAIVGFLNFGFYSLTVPLVNAMEEAVCHEHNHSIDVHNPLATVRLREAPSGLHHAGCKSAPVQVRLAWVLGLLSLLQYAGGKDRLILSYFLLRRIDRYFGDCHFFPSFFEAMTNTNGADRSYYNISAWRNIR